MPNKNIKNNENTKEAPKERIIDGDYTLNNYFSSKYAKNYK